jgi:hypothetical protein
MVGNLLNRDDQGLPIIDVASPTYDCPVHGETNVVMFVVIPGKRRRVYCTECFDEHLAAHLPVLQEREDILG